MIKRILVLLVISLCILSLSFHFIVEGLGGVHDHFIGYQVRGGMESHEGDQFILGESEPYSTVQAIPLIPVPSNLNLTSRPFPPPFHPPKFA